LLNRVVLEGAAFKSAPFFMLFIKVLTLDYSPVMQADHLCIFVLFQKCYI